MMQGSKRWQKAWKGAADDTDGEGIRFLEKPILEQNRKLALNIQHQSTISKKKQVGKLKFYLLHDGNTMKIHGSLR